jgi:hypothetical protein
MWRNMMAKKEEIKCVGMAERGGEDMREVSK